jgi:hypothetical protein
VAREGLYQGGDFEARQMHSDANARTEAKSEMLAVIACFVEALRILPFALVAVG